MTSHQLKELMGFVEEHYELLVEYLGKAPEGRNQRAGVAAAAELYRALGDATQFTSELEIEEGIYVEN